MRDEQPQQPQHSPSPASQQQQQQQTETMAAIDPEVANIEKIEECLEKITEIGSEIDNFNGTKQDKEYKFMDEMLVQSMLQLDSVVTSHDETRAARKQAVKKAQELINKLERKASAAAGGAS